MLSIEKQLCYFHHHPNYVFPTHIHITTLDDDDDDDVDILFTLSNNI